MQVSLTEATKQKVTKYSNNCNWIYMMLFCPPTTECCTLSENGGIEIKLQLFIQPHDRTQKLSQLHATSVTDIRECITPQCAKGLCI